MPLQPVGSQWLKEHYNLSHHNLTHSSYIGSNASVELTSKGNVEQVYGTKYRVSSEEPLSHIEFSLKYDDLSLDFLKVVFEKITTAEMKKAYNEGLKFAHHLGSNAADFRFNTWIKQNL